VLQPRAHLQLQLLVPYVLGTWEISYETMPGRGGVEIARCTGGVCRYGDHGDDRPGPPRESLQPQKRERNQSPDESPAGLRSHVSCRIRSKQR
jgi:hypothetical protein